MNVAEQSPNLEEWRAVYAAALAFRELGCWRWMYDSDVFGVQDPETGVIGYCTVMGHLGQMFALGVYPGAAGLATLNELRDRPDEPPDPAILHEQDCLMASFGERALLTDRDHQLFKQLGQTFRGKVSWPWLRSYRPGYYPWFLTPAEARTLTVALQQAAVVGARAQTELNLHLPRPDGSILVRQRDGDSWQDAWRTPPPPPAAAPMPAWDTARAQAVGRRQLPRHGAWEVDFAYFPATIGPPGQRPYVPLSLLCVDAASYYMLTTHIAQRGQHLAEFQPVLFQVMEQSKWLPEEFRVKRPEVGDWLKPLATALSIPVRLAAHLPALEDARQGMDEFLSRRR